MRLHFILGISTCLTGIAVLLFSIDYFVIKEITAGELAGSVILLFVMARLKFAWINRKK